MSIALPLSLLAGVTVDALLLPKDSIYSLALALMIIKNDCSWIWLLYYCASFGIII